MSVPVSASASEDVTEGASGTGPLADYRAQVRTEGGPDEWYDASHRLRPEQHPITSAVDQLGLPGLLAARGEARRLVEDDGIRYGPGAMDDDADPGRSWVIDPLPVVIGSQEWAGLESALRQRALLLQLLHDDLYGARRLLSDRVLPADVVLGHPGFIRGADGIAHQRLVLTATDLARDADGAWAVLADKTAAPAGAGYAMANRRVTSRVLGPVHRRASLARLRGFFDTMARALGAVAGSDVDTPRVVLLSPGTGAETAFDQGFLATLLGFPLVEGDDLSVRDGRVWIRSTGRSEPVDVVLRRLDAEFCDPLELRADSQLGLPGLVESARRGTVHLANPLGSGVLENPGLTPYLPALSRRLLGEDLALPSATTWWCGEPAELSHVLAHLDTLVVKPISRGAVVAARFGWDLSSAERDDLRREISARPWAWVGQEPIAMSTAPVVTPTGLTPGRFVLRTFGVAHADEHHVMPGGLGRVNTSAASLLVSNASGALAKDVWVLTDEPSGLRGWASRDPATQPALVRLQRRAAVAPRVADNLFWVGRYAERAEGIARLLRVADDLAEDHAQRPDTPGAATMAVMVAAGARLTGLAPQPGMSPSDHIRAMVGTPQQVGTLAHTGHRIVAAAENVRDQLSQDIWHVLSRLARTLATPAPTDVPLRQQLDVVLESLLAVAGVVHESMVRDQTWGFLDGGVRVERAQHTVALLRATLAVERAPITDGQVTESVLEACESILTHRRRTASGEGPAWPIHSATSLLLVDPGNPRSVAFQVARLGKALRLAADDDLVERAEALGASLADLDLVDVCAGDRAELRDVLATVETTLRAISADLTARHFSRKPTQRVLLGDWAGAGRP
ncbi:Uncharacterized conserved protein, circularly permuted ATPgrasp superfamily [Nocardioides alpinus]|uniref:Uncharacterized conserved protein, circularly permuted ATPgrasp superfamily n=1 Tax=Nocardioides alpinus TaxID=748909 RepID=A0A1I0X8F3_9ACTN|nr:circularly permuted type 2 ATP-grasp protein [Nocardioides alpinus]PKH44178.1 hypothetical protein CXG46_01045 [Nocardioides alpinus]SFA96967.1 Uncharacterized conserved protein, circularly permuted ATPgrasp superfamily [Nocardioides alpinus]